MLMGSTHLVVSSTQQPVLPAIMRKRKHCTTTFTVRTTFQMEYQQLQDRMLKALVTYLEVLTITTIMDTQCKDSDGNLNKQYFE